MSDVAMEPFPRRRGKNAANTSVLRHASLSHASFLRVAIRGARRAHYIAAVLDAPRYELSASVPKILRGTAVRNIYDNIPLSQVIPGSTSAHRWVHIPPRSTREGQSTASFVAEAWRTSAGSIQVQMRWHWSGGVDLYLPWRFLTRSTPCRPRKRAAPVGRNFGARRCRKHIRFV